MAVAAGSGGRANDGSDAPDAYRPKDHAGVYVPTAITISSMAEHEAVRQRAPLNRKTADCQEVASQPTIAIQGTADRSVQTKRPSRPKVARFWLVRSPMAYHPFARQLVTAKR
jgi:hypothetical protein